MNKDSIEKFLNIMNSAKENFRIQRDGEEAFDGLDSDQILNLIKYRTFRELLLERVSKELGEKIDREEEQNRVIENLKQAVSTGDISDFEFQEIIESKDYKEFFK